jgi:hypothetical protein
MKTYSLGVGDRFGHEGEAQLSAILRAKEEHGIEITPVWNKSYREHKITGTTPREVRKEAENAITSLNWNGSYYVDADHINLRNVEPFIPYSNFFTIDVAEYINHSTEEVEIKEFFDNFESYFGKVSVPGINHALNINRIKVEKTIQKFMYAIKKAGILYHHILKKRKGKPFIAEISMDETVNPQSPIELFVILAIIHQQEIPIDTFAPKFPGDFYKGIDYVGEIPKFKDYFNQSLAILSYTKDLFGFKPNLKFSIHSGSDKFSLYPIINTVIKKYNMGLHLKTAGTTWLEEIIGLIKGSQEAFNLVKRIYKKAYIQLDKLITPYETVVDINKNNLPKPSSVENWKKGGFFNALNHNPSHPNYNKDLRQLLHISYAVAAKMKREFYRLISRNRYVIRGRVTENLYERHIKPLFL